MKTFKEFLDNGLMTEAKNFSDPEKIWLFLEMFDIKNSVFIEVENKIKFKILSITKEGDKTIFALLKTDENN